MGQKAIEQKAIEQKPIEPKQSKELLAARRRVSCHCPHSNEARLQRLYNSATIFFLLRPRLYSHPSMGQPTRVSNPRDRGPCPHERKLKSDGLRSLMQNIPELQ